MSRNRSPRGGRPPHHQARRELGPSQRQLRVGEALRHALAEVLRRNDIQDSDLEGVSVTITQVKPSPDMRYAEDDSFAEAQKIESILRSPEVQRDLAAPESSSDEDGEADDF